MMLIHALAIASQLTLTAANDVPKFNVEPSCRGAIANAGPGQRDVAACMKDETDARNTLKKDWSGYGGADRSRCTRAATLGGQPSYVELLVCLEMIKYARTGPGDPIAPVGSTVPKKRP